MKAPRSWPNSSLSSSVSGSAAQLTGDERPLARAAARQWSARATSSLPVPLSPRMSTARRRQRDALDQRVELAHRATAADERRHAVARLHPQQLVLEPQAAVLGRALGMQHELVEPRRTKGTADADTLYSANLLAGMLGSLGHIAESERRHRQLRVLAETMLGCEHRVTLSIMDSVTGQLYLEGRHFEAAEQQRLLCNTRLRLLGQLDVLRCSA